MPAPGLPPPGTATVIATADEILVRLAGEIDLSLRADLIALVPVVMEHGRDLIVDASAVTFCDGTLAAFLAEIIGQERVSVRAPTRLVQEVLALYAGRPRRS